MGLALVGIACSDPLDCASPSLAVGTGEQAPVLLDAGDPVRLVHGPQGGWHVEVAGVITHTGPEIAVSPTLTVPDSGLQLAGAQQPTFLALDGYDLQTCSGRFAGVRAYLDDPLPEGSIDQALICELHGQSLQLSVSAEDLASGAVATAQVTVEAERDPADACR